MAAALWPDQIDESARSNLRRAIWQAPGWIMAEGGEVLLDAQVDLAAVRAIAGRALAGDAMTFTEIEALSTDLLRVQASRRPAAPWSASAVTPWRRRPATRRWRPSL
ncbi:hypothetical protein MPEAHAMD_4760 [Methylobacterium frigidaeris]|uniref:Uncharacterized protein n=1 Tax=Methylobacterium frigidaeris TaxID=2038277 RepID=A0AA37HEY8_9HYPH|nr:hypothetical protein MPEAHAMD_4760 [Methylobacterium frigidaeris]